MANLIVRGSTYYLRRRVPRRYEPVEPRKTVEISLHTDSEKEAVAKAVVAWDQMVAAWEARRDGDSADAEARFEAARDLAGRRGFKFMPAARVATLPTEELLKRVEAVPERNGEPDRIEAAAVLGGATEPPITISRALELFWTLTRDRTTGKSADQVRRWENPRKKSIKNLIDVIGDKAIKDITGDDMLDFREWWQDRLANEELTPNSANKDLTHLGDVLKTINRLKRLGLVLPLTGLKIKAADAKKRPPFSRVWIKDHLLKSGALAGLNAEARAIFLVMVNTGARPSEIAALTANTIKLQDNVPHIMIRPEGRTLKTKRAKRDIPVVGVSLEALRAFPSGFPRYRGSSASLSATVNKFLRENALVPPHDPQGDHLPHTMYSLRHSFEDRMIAAGIDDRIRRDLFGHRLDREEYGDGATLEHLHQIVEAIAL